MGKPNLPPDLEKAIIDYWCDKFVHEIIYGATPGQNPTFADGGLGPPYQSSVKAMKPAN